MYIPIIHKYFCSFSLEQERWSYNYASNYMFYCFALSSTFCGKVPDWLWIVSPPSVVQSLETKYRNYSSVNIFVFNKGLQFKIWCCKTNF